MEPGETYYNSHPQLKTNLNCEVALKELTFFRGTIPGIAPTANT